MPSPEEDAAASLAILGESGALRIRLRVVPGARRQAILGVHGDALRVAVRAAPEQGQANRAVEELLAAELGLGRAAVSIERGAGGRDKVVRLSGLDAVELRQRVGRAVAATRSSLSATTGATRRRASSPGE